MKPRWSAIPALIMSSQIGLQADQQAHLTIGRSQVDVLFYLAASHRDGGPMFAHIDTDASGRLSQAEQDRFAREVVRSASLSVDGKAFPLAATQFVLPDRQAMASGRGIIRI